MRGPRWLSRPRGYALLGDVWAGGSAAVAPGGVVVGPTGILERILVGAAADVRSQLPIEFAVLDGSGRWIGPAVIDAHVHLGLGPGGSARDPLGAIGPGLAGVRDLGSPADAAARAQSASLGGGRRALGLRGGSGGPAVSVAGPILTSPGGYPSTTWGAGSGVSTLIASPAQARLVVRSLAARGVDVIKVALEPGASNLPTPTRAMLRSVVQAAHDAGLPVVAHALRARMVTRALDCGVDEFAHTPTERLSDELIERIVGAGIGVVSTLQTFFSEGEGADAAVNAAALVRAGGILRYGTDLGNTGTVPGVDPRELDRLAHAGLGRLGALRAATEGSAAAVGMRGASGRLIIGAPAGLVLLDGDPLREPALWRAPLATALGRSLRMLATPDARQRPGPAAHEGHVDHPAPAPTGPAVAEGDLRPGSPRARARRWPSPNRQRA